MPNYGIVRPVGGQSRPLSAFMDDRRQEHDAQVRDQEQQMQLQDAYQQRADRTALRDIVKRSGGDWNKAASEAAAAGVDPQSLIALQDRARGDEDRQRTLKERGNADTDRARKEAVDKLSVASKVAEMIDGVNDPASYAQYRQQAGEVAKQYGIPFDMPETYDPKYVEQKKAVVRELHQAYRVMTPAEEEKAGLDPAGSYKIALRGDKKGDIVTINKPPSEQKSVLQWSDVAPNDPAASRFPTGSVIQRASNGRVLPSYTPPKGGAGGGGPARAQLSQFLVTNKIAPDMKTAWQMSGEAAMNPRKFALEMTKLERGDMAPKADAGEIEARMRYWTDFANKLNEEENGGAPASPQYQEGKIYVDGQGNRAMYQNGQWVPQ